MKSWLKKLDKNFMVKRLRSNIKIRKKNTPLKEKLSTAAKTEEHQDQLQEKPVTKKIQENQAQLKIFQILKFKKNQPS